MQNDETCRATSSNDNVGTSDTNIKAEYIIEIPVYSPDIRSLRVLVGEKKRLGHPSPGKLAKQKR